MKRAQADLLTNVEGAAPMGALFRQFWLPVLHSERLVAGKAPMKIRILGEDYVAFRDATGNAGLIGELCPHRGVSMLLARNEDCGLRCIQHGWKIDASGKVVEAPNMPADAPLHRIPTNGRPVVERHGIVWAWFGDAEQAPPLTPYDFTTLPEGHVDSIMATGQCNWLQLLETLWDPYHVSALHASVLRKTMQAGTTKTTYGTGLMDLEFEPRPYGFDFHWTLQGKRQGNPFVFPCWSIHMVGATVQDDCLAIGHVPIDNENHLMWGVVYNHAHPLKPDGRGRKFINSFPRKYEYREGVNRENLWRQDRARMESGDSWSGLDVDATPYGVLMEDFCSIESMGPLYDRSREHLAPTDKVTMLARSRLLRALADMEGGAPAPAANGEGLGVLPSFEFLEAAE